MISEDLRKWFKEKWVRFGPDGKIRGDCARGDDSEGKPKCLPQSKAHSLGKDGRKYAASKKRREDPNPERKGAAKNVATKKKTNEDVTEIELKFKTIELSNDNIVSYAKQYFESNNIEAPHQKFISNIKMLSNAKLTESKENAEIQEFIKALARVDSKKKIKVGDKFAVLAFEIRFAWREIDALGFTEPKEIADIKLHSDGTINYIKFTDGDRYPRLIQATRNSKPIIQAVYFDDKNKAEKALTYLNMLVPDNWEIDMNEIKKAVSEEQLDELKCWPGYSRVQGVTAGAPGSCKKKTNEEDLGMNEGQPIVSVKKWAEQVRQEHGVDTKFWNDKVHNRIIARKDNEIVGSYDRKANNGTVFSGEGNLAEGLGGGTFSNVVQQAFKYITSLSGKLNSIQALRNLPLFAQHEKLALKYVLDNIYIPDMLTSPDSKLDYLQDWIFERLEHNIQTLLGEYFSKIKNELKTLEDQQKFDYLLKQGRVIDRYTKSMTKIIMNKLNNSHKNTQEAVSEGYGQDAFKATTEAGAARENKDMTEEKCPQCAGPMFSEALMMEKKDACYYKVKSRYKVWPSAYASGALVKCRNKGSKNWGNKSESAIMRGIQNERKLPRR